MWSSSGCPVSMFPCYKDCCQRGGHFCNHNPRERRCQHCSTRERYCGNYTYLPYECDAYCLKQEIIQSCGQSKDTTQMVDVAFYWSTFAVAAVLALMLVYEGVRCCRKKRNRFRFRQQRGAGRYNYNQGDSPTSDSFLLETHGSLTNPDDQQADTADAPEFVNNLVLPPLGHSAANQATPRFHSERAADFALDVSSLLGEPLTVSFTPPSTRHQPPGGDTQQTSVKAPASSACSTDERRSTIQQGRSADGQSPATGAADEDHSRTWRSHTPAIIDSENTTLAKMTCGDLRMGGNIPPSSDKDPVVSIHTGHRGSPSGDLS